MIPAKEYFIVRYATKAFNKIEGWLHLDLKYYLKNTSYLLSIQGVTLITGLASSIVLTRLLPRETYGQYSYVFSILGMLTIFSLPGIGTAITQTVAKGHDRVLIDGTKTRLKWSILGAIGTLSVGIYYYLSGEILLAKPFMAAFLLFPMYSAFDSFYSFLYARKRFDKVAKYQSISRVLSTLVIIAIVFLTRNLLWMVVASLVASILLKAYFFWRTTQEGNLNQSRDETAIAYGKKLTAIQIMPAIRMYYDKIIVGIALGFSDLAIYSIAVAISEIAKEPASAISAVLFPKLSAIDEKTAYREVKRRMPQLILIVAIICGIGALLSPYIIPLLYSKKYLDSVLYAQILFASVAISVPGLVLQKALFPAQRKTKELFKVNTAYSIVDMTLLTVLTLKFGLLGLVVARFISRSFNTLYSWILAR